MSSRVLSFLLAVAFVVTPARGQTGRDYPDGHGGKVFFPLGDASFADAVESFEEGQPAAKKPANRDRNHIVGVPNYDKKAATNYVSLGCGGTIVVRFTDNALVDVEGPDLYVFEVGPAVEPTALAISEDGKTWIEVGKVAGGRADVDIHAFDKERGIFHFVRLTDLKSSCPNDTPGADVDALGAIGSALQISLSGGVLFDTNQSTLKPESRSELDRVVAQINGLSASRIMIEGHTDSVGSAASNQVLSEKRAAAVRDYFAAAGLSRSDMVARGYGASRPVATNDTDEGRARNRRVEVIVVPARK